LHHRESQRVWLMVLRSLLRFLAQRGHIPEGWDSVLPGIGNYQHARLPRCLSPEQGRSLFRASAGSKIRNLRDRALLLLFLRLGLRLGEVAHLWKQQKSRWPIPSALVLDWVTLGSDRRRYYAARAASF
jgi:site-specific recombinase XerD